MCVPFTWKGQPTLLLLDDLVVEVEVKFDLSMY